MPDNNLRETICSVTPTLCALLGVPPPECYEAVSEEVVHEAGRIFKGGRAQKCLVFAPDALGCHLTARHPDIFNPVSSLAPLKLSLRSMVPPKTPVCFASMFTGLLPDLHGIQCYEKPVLRCGTLFDAVAGAGMRMAIVAVEDSSIDMIFRGREIDYYSEKYDPQVTDRALSLLEGDQYDFILAYHQEYDDVMHGSEPFSQKAMEAVEHHIEGFSRLSEAVDRHWGSFNRAIVFAPDHGAHLDLKTGRGTHGDDIPEDMEVCHYWGFRSGEKREIESRKR